MYHLLEDGGHLCLIVPAFQLIFGKMDATDNHYRRYTKRLIIEKIEKPGFNIIKSKVYKYFGIFWLSGLTVRL